MRIRQCLQAQAICCGAIEDDEHLCAGAEVLPEFSYGRIGIYVIAVSNSVSSIHGGDCFQDLGMDACIVVTGKATSGFHRDNQGTRAGGLLTKRA